jgi:hypothetical protein
MRPKGAIMKMRTMLGVLLASGLTYAATASAQTCELPCAAECRQEAAICFATAALTARADKATCESDGTDGLIGCDGDAIDTRSNCVGLCGDQLKTCVGDAKTTLKTCRDGIKADQDTCKADVMQVLSDDKASCAQDVTDCLDSCNI